MFDIVQKLESILIAQSTGATSNGMVKLCIKVNSPRSMKPRPNLGDTNNAIIRRGNFGGEFMSPTATLVVVVRLRFSNIFRLSPAAFPNLSKPRTCSARVFSPHLFHGSLSLCVLCALLSLPRNRPQIADRLCQSMASHMGEFEYAPN